MSAATRAEHAKQAAFIRGQVKEEWSDVRKRRFEASAAAHDEDVETAKAWLAALGRSAGRGDVPKALAQAQSEHFGSTQGQDVLSRFLSSVESAVGTAGWGSLRVV